MRIHSIVSVPPHGDESDRINLTKNRTLNWKVGLLFFRFGFGFCFCVIRCSTSASVLCQTKLRPRGIDTSLKSQTPRRAGVGAQPTRHPLATCPHSPTAHSAWLFRAAARSDSHAPLLVSSWPSPSLPLPPNPNPLEAVAVGRRGAVADGRDTPSRSGGWSSDATWLKIATGTRNSST